MTHYDPDHWSDMNLTAAEWRARRDNPPTPEPTATPISTRPTEPTRQADRYPHRRLRVIPPPTYTIENVPWWKIKKSTVVSLGWWCLYSMGISAAAGVLFLAIEMVAYALHR